MDSAFKSPLTSISIGPGIRGIERGVERVVRLEHLAYVEIEAYIIENMVAQMERLLLAPAVIWSDAKTCPWEIFRGLVDILFAGYPCQPFSTAGKRLGTEDPRHLYPYIERAIRIIRPGACFFENVRGHVTCGLPEVIASLEGLGYRVHWGIYSAEETGAAHKRERVFILAVANSEGTGIRRRLRDVHQTDGGSNGELPFITDGSGNELANSGLFRQEVGQQQASGSKECGELADDNCLNGREQQQIEGSNGAGSRDEVLREWLRAESGGSETVAYVKCQGLEGKQKQSAREEQQAIERSGRQGTVSRPGEPQQAWEHTRVISRKIESSVGLSAHGYHFREDILRALGNSVYEDTAELAFRDLLRKHGIV